MRKIKMERCQKCLKNGIFRHLLGIVPQKYVVFKEVLLYTIRSVDKFLVLKYEKICFERYGIKKWHY